MAGEASLMGGLDPEALKGLLASLQPLTQALGPSPEDKEAAKYRAIAQAGLAMMGGRRGQEFDTIGRAGLLGLQGYNQDLQQIGQQRQQGMGLLSALMPMLQKSNLPGAVWGEGGQQPAPAPAQGAVGGSGMGGGTPALFGASSQPGPVAAPSANVTALSLGKQLVNLGYSPQLINGVLSTSKEPMKDLLDLYKEGVKIHTGAGNIPMQRNPQTGQIDAMPAAGYNEALGRADARTDRCARGSETALHAAKPEPARRRHAAGLRRSTAADPPRQCGRSGIGGHGGQLRSKPLTCARG
jgi:hypothetical protein